ncbi:hypothetical protein CHS0354_000440 [Potamilus streckersoni]|uniref:Cation efflux protein transmembrane domain-containing protein n=1 Tax=Potamilus streckersoni TaxID=2493646 RepID=A0AAE0T6L4_9BIVA|nr:hypothetical protein CHS0354_000440 [Potamilus streckersoni]
MNCFGCSPSLNPNGHLLPVSINGNVGYIDTTGQIIIKPEMQDGLPFREGFAVVKVRNVFGIIDPTGAYTLRPLYLTLSSFSEGLARVLSNKRFGYLNRQMKISIPSTFMNARDFSSGLAAVENEDGKWGYINSIATIMIPFQFDHAFSFNNERACVVVNGKCGFIDLRGNRVVAPIFEDARDFSFERAPVKKEGKWGFINQDGFLEIPFQFQYVKPFSHNGLAPVMQNDLWGYINTKGNPIIPYHFQEAEPFSEGLAVVKMNDKWGYIDQSGAWIIEPQFEIAEAFDRGFARVLNADAMHDFGDSIGLGLSWYLDVKSKKDPSREYPFGYHRFSLLGALINCIVLILGSIVAINEAIERIIVPEHSDAEGMFIFALFGILINGFAAYKLSSSKNLNEKMARWHLFEDVLGWFSVLIVSTVLLFYDNPYLDPVLSVCISFVIVWQSWKKLKEVMYVFLLGKPTELDMEELKHRMLQIPYVKSIHLLRVLSLDEHHCFFFAHLKIEHYDNVTEVKKNIKAVLKEFTIEYSIIEIETENELCEFDDTDLNKREVSLSCKGVPLF